MKILNNHPRLSATDLANHLACRHLTRVDLSAAKGELSLPKFEDPSLKVLRKRGLQHEEAYLDQLRAQGRKIFKLSEGSQYEETLAAMQEGADVIVQAALENGRWVGRADVLLRVNGGSDVGDWHYEVVDTKLARETRAGTILQLCLYSEIVGMAQGRRPEWMKVVSPGKDFEPECFRVDHYFSYYGFVKRRLEEAVDGSVDRKTYPEPVPHCDVCLWWSRCDRRRRDDDHLSLVAGMSSFHRVELGEWGIGTLKALGESPLQPERRPKRGTRKALDRMQDQARVQLIGRHQGKPYYETLEVTSEEGLSRLPELDEGDVFFDIEGDAFVGEGGLEYLFGWITIERNCPQYNALWARDGTEEKAVFEAFLDAMMEQRRRFPKMHVYHFAPYEPTALKRLASRYATRENALDELLRARVFVDLYAVARQGVRASVESYSIKKLEAFYGYKREVELQELGMNKRKLEAMLELGEEENLPVDMQDVVQRYNEDDCRSTWKLRDWLEGVRAKLILEGKEVPRPEPLEGQPTEALKEQEQRVNEMRERLIAGISNHRMDRTDEAQARWLLAYILDWHWREEKAAWWEYFRLKDLTDEELFEEKTAIADLKFVEELPVPGKEKSPRHRYRFPKQITEIRENAGLKDGNGEDFGSVVAIDQVRSTIDIKKLVKKKTLHPTSVFEFNLVRSGVLADSIMKIAEWVAENGIDAPGPYRPGRDLLLNRPPRLADGSPQRLCLPTEEPVDAARRLALQLNGGLLPIQGPPGSGKTYAGGRMVTDLVNAGKKVGVTAASHKVIANLLDEVVKAAGEEKVSLQCVQKVKHQSEEKPDGILEVTKNHEPLELLKSGEARVAGGTAWLWARPEYEEVVDVLFVDEAGQMSLANVVAIARCAKNIVLLGDPQQLEQPQKGSHPEGTEVAALQHVLGDAETMPAENGLFLEQTWRLHPDICGFTSTLFYDGKLAPREGMEGQVISGPTRYAGTGLWLEPVEHEGNQSSSEEEVERVAMVVGDLLQSGVTWTNPKEEDRPLTERDILVVAPYNAQVFDLQRELGPSLRVGTVDKFQGQEAPVVICSMTTSSPEEAPRGMEFLYSPNRLNVATSRARCACILVANPRIFEPECRSPRQMRLANAFCRYVEMAGDA